MLKILEKKYYTDQEIQTILNSLPKIFDLKIVEDTFIIIGYPTQIEEKINIVPREFIKRAFRISSRYHDYEERQNPAERLPADIDVTKISYNEYSEELLRYKDLLVEEILKKIEKNKTSTEDTYKILVRVPIERENSTLTNEAIANALAFMVSKDLAAHNIKAIVFAELVYMTPFQLGNILEDKKDDKIALNHGL
ncbi:MAG: hypothetical protein N3D10_03560 [Candidatus Micrarchaeota archaeon]|nr:hypothetical protein [Candidatus Micrarchaeota archaeon]